MSKKQGFIVVKYSNFYKGLMILFINLSFFMTLTVNFDFGRKIYFFNFCHQILMR